MLHPSLFHLQVSQQHPAAPAAFETSSVIDFFDNRK
jgi:cytosine/uracil/thiamine/allantoin permease